MSRSRSVGGLTAGPPLGAAEPLTTDSSFFSGRRRPQEPVAISDLQARLYSYESLAQFERDVKLIFSNCAYFNAPWSDAARDAQSACLPLSVGRGPLAVALTPRSRRLHSRPSA